jgi:hypothetical protein
MVSLHPTAAMARRPSCYTAVTIAPRRRSAPPSSGCSILAARLHIPAWPVREGVERPPGAFCVGSDFTSDATFATRREAQVTAYCSTTSPTRPRTPSAALTSERNEVARVGAKRHSDDYVECVEFRHCPLAGESHHRGEDGIESGPRLSLRPSIGAARGGLGPQRILPLRRSRSWLRLRPFDDLWGSVR